MTANITFHITYDREKDGTLAEFRVKYNKFRGHIQRLQANGVLPRGDLRWSLHNVHPEQNPPKSPGAVAARVVPILIHVQGTRIDPDRIAV